MTEVNIIALIIGIWFIAFIVRCGLHDCLEAEGFEFVNPIYLYNQIRVNWFGAILLALIWNILFAPYAIFYWLYKLCTVGRRWGNETTNTINSNYQAS